MNNMTQMELKRIAQITDPQLRNALIGMAENMEAMLRAGTITTSTPIGATLVHGLRVEIKIDDKGKIFSMIYSLNREMFQKYLLDNPNLTEGILSFVSKGIEITVPPGENAVQKTGFSMDGPDGERDWLPLLERPVTFTVHRNVFGGKEWECFYNDDEQQ